MHVILSTVPPDAARALAAQLVEQRLAACVNIVPGLTSVFRWKGATHDDAETLLVIKTSAQRLPDLMARLPQLHPYEVPEIVVLDPTSVHAPYAQWVEDETSDVKGG